MAVIALLLIAWFVREQFHFKEVSRFRLRIQPIIFGFFLLGVMASSLEESPLLFFSLGIFCWQGPRPSVGRYPPLVVY
ncbi:MAG: hypothetical protein FWF59_04440 [Turicibacter sp.]|nr:hypothetical protein [Turicibacter sp.]